MRKLSQPQRPCRRGQRGQRGASVIVVIAMLMLLAVIAVGGAFRLGRLAELVVGNASDMARTRAAADALLRDAETDILGSLPSYAVAQPGGMLGYPCQPAGGSLTTPRPGSIGCRTPGGAPNAPVNPWFPYNWDEYQKVVDLVNAASPQGCFQAICAPQAVPIEQQLAVMTPLGATYGQYTRAGMPAPGVSGNSVLSGAARAGWYWIEAFQYQPAAGAAQALPLPSAGFVPLYRITVVAQGVKAGSQVVLKSWFSPLARTR